MRCRNSVQPTARARSLSLVLQQSSTKQTCNNTATAPGVSLSGAVAERIYVSSCMQGAVGLSCWTRMSGGQTSGSGRNSVDLGGPAGFMETGAGVPGYVALSLEAKSSPPPLPTPFSDGACGDPSLGYIKVALEKRREGLRERGGGGAGGLLVPSESYPVLSVVLLILCFWGCSPQTLQLWGSSAPFDPQTTPLHPHPTPSVQINTHTTHTHTHNTQHTSSHTCTHRAGKMYPWSFSQSDQSRPLCMVSLYRRTKVGSTCRAHAQGSTPNASEYNTPLDGHLARIRQCAHTGERKRHKMDE